MLAGNPGGIQEIAKTNEKKQMKTEILFSEKAIVILWLLDAVENKWRSKNKQKENLKEFDQKLLYNSLNEKVVVYWEALWDCNVSTVWKGAFGKDIKMRR